jgi:hypothetical protein
MLGYVKQSELDAVNALLVTEREARITAEARASIYASTIEDLQERLRQAIASNFQQGERHAYAQAMLLKHIIPIAPVNPNAPDTPLKPQTAAEILAEPASTKREMFLREIRANQARLREMDAAARSDYEKRQALLTPEERRATMPDFDPMLGVFEQPEATEAGDANAVI